MEAEFPEPLIEERRRQAPLTVGRVEMAKGAAAIRTEQATAPPAGSPVALQLVRRRAARRPLRRHAGGEHHVGAPERAPRVAADAAVAHQAPQRQAGRGQADAELDARTVATALEDFGLGRFGCVRLVLVVHLCCDVRHLGKSAVCAPELCFRVISENEVGNGKFIDSCPRFSMRLISCRQVSLL